jgi:hypothetical protein
MLMREHKQNSSSRVLLAGAKELSFPANVCARIRFLTIEPVIGHLVSWDQIGVAMNGRSDSLDLE